MIYFDKDNFLFIKFEFLNYIFLKTFTKNKIYFIFNVKK